MKRRIIVLLVLLIAINSYGLDLLSAEFSTEIGWLPQGTLRMYESRSKYDLANTFYIIMSNRTTLFDLLFIGGSVDVSMHWAGQTFDTDGIDYMFETGLQFGILELFYKHNCIHPAPTWIYYRKIIPTWETSHDRIGLKISTRIN